MISVKFPFYTERAGDAVSARSFMHGRAQQTAAECVFLSGGKVRLIKVGILIENDKIQRFLPFTIISIENHMEGRQEHGQRSRKHRCISGTGETENQRLEFGGVCAFAQKDRGGSDPSFK